jgi:hypothetical protein
MYFICYVWRTYEDKWIFANKTLDGEHPLQWLSRIRREDPNPKYHLVSWQKLSDDEGEFGQPFIDDI